MSILDQYNQAMELDETTGKPMRKTSVVGMSKAVAVVPSDVDVITATKGLYLGAAGDVVVTMVDGSDITLKGLSAGVIHELNVTAVKATGTLATDIVALY